MGWVAVIIMAAAMIAIDWWRRRCWRRWDQKTSKEDRSLAGAMERSRQNETR